MTIPFKRLRAWTDPASVVAPAFAHVSYALFCLDRGVDGISGPHTGRILAARSPDGTQWRLGAPLPDLADLTEPARQFLATGLWSEASAIDTPSDSNALTETPADTEPGSLFVWTRTGLGLLTRRYALTADLGLLLHLHIDPLVGARLLAGGVFAGEQTISGGFALSSRVRAAAGHLTERDMPTYTRFNEARVTLSDLLAGFEPSRQAPLGAIEMSPTPLGYLTAVPLSAIFAMAAFAGCRLTVELDGHPIVQNERLSDSDRLFIPEPERDFIACHSPQVLELLLLGLFSEVRAYSRDRSAICRISSGRLWAAPSLSLDYVPVSTLTPPDIDHLLNLRTHLSRVAAFHGMELSATSIPLLLPSASPLHQSMTLDWLADPTLLPTSDLKAHLYLRDEDEK